MLLLFVLLKVTLGWDRILSDDVSHILVGNVIINSWLIVGKLCKV